MQQMKKLGKSYSLLAKLTAGLALILPGRLITFRGPQSRLLDTLFLLLILPVAVQGQFTFATNNGTLIVTSYIGSNGIVMIPDMTNGMPVTGIGNSAFSYQYILTNVTIPYTLTNIGPNAFFNCTNLTDVTIGTNVISIGTAAFSSCSRLSAIMIPDSVKKIGKDALLACTSLSGITVEASNLFYSSLQGVLFDKAQTTLLQAPGAIIGNYTVPGTVLTITSSSFGYCNQLT